MRIIDLSQPLRHGMTVGANMPVYQRNPARLEVIVCHSTEHAEKLRRRGSVIATDVEVGYVATASRLLTTTHTSTHVDAPAHFDEDGLTIERVPLETFIAPASVFDLSYKESREPIRADDLIRADPGLRRGEWTLVKTGWNETHGDGISHHYEDAPYLHRSVGEWLLEKGILGLGSDCWGDEPIWDPQLKAEELAPIHRLLLPAGVILLENLTNMLQISRPKVQLIALPLLLPFADGSPVRAVAIEE